MKLLQICLYTILFGSIISLFGHIIHCPLVVRIYSGTNERVVFTFERKWHFGEYFIIVCTGSCHLFNLRCSRPVTAVLSKWHLCFNIADKILRRVSVFIELLMSITRSKDLIRPNIQKYTETKSRHFDEILITGCTGNCDFDNFQCSHWCKFNQNEDIHVSLY